MTEKNRKCWVCGRLLETYKEKIIPHGPGPEGGPCPGGTDELPPPPKPASDDIRKEYAARMGVAKVKAEKLARKLFAELSKGDLKFEEQSMVLIFQSAYYITSFVEANRLHHLPHQMEDWSIALRHVVDDILAKRYPTEWKRWIQKSGGSHERLER